MSSEAGAEHQDESDMLRVQIASGPTLGRVGKARTRLALPYYREGVSTEHSLAF